MIIAANLPWLILPSGGRGPYDDRGRHCVSLTVGVMFGGPGAAIETGGYGNTAKIDVGSSRNLFSALIV